MWLLVKTGRVILAVLPFVLLVILLARISTLFPFKDSTAMDESTEISIHGNEAELSDISNSNNSHQINPSWPPLPFSPKNFYGDKRLLKYEYAFVPRTKPITPLNFRFIITAEDLCDKKDGPTLLVLIMSLPSMRRQRHAIRATWGSVAVGHPWPGRRLNGSIKIIFLFGKTNNTNDQKILEQESERTDDVVQADFKESYFNLTYKVLMGFKWAEKYCPGAQYIMKCDDDTFFNVPYILNFLKAIGLENTIYGPFFYVDSVSRKMKFRVEPTSFPAPVYPPHVKGNMYIMPRKLALNIAHVAEYMPYVNVEDAYITGVLAKIFDARHIGIPKRLYHMRKPSKKCDLALEKKMISQQIFENDFFMIWYRIDRKELCKRGRYV